jgi:hypothetical protein
MKVSRRLQIYPQNFSFPNKILKVGVFVLNIFTEETKIKLKERIHTSLESSTLQTFSAVIH